MHSHARHKHGVHGGSTLTYPSKPPEPARAGHDSEFWRPSRRTRGATDLGGGRILVVDDEPSVCVYVALALKRLGLESSATTDPHEALDRILDDPGRFRLLLTDQRMPGLTGLELIKRVWARHPSFPVVLMSGYSWGFDPSSLPGVGLLGKPFELDELEKALRQALHLQV